MTSLPEEEPHERWTVPEGRHEEPAFPQEPDAETAGEPPMPPSGGVPALTEGDGVSAPSQPAGLTSGEAYLEPPRLELLEPAPHFERIPNFGHLCILCTLLLFGLLCTGVVTALALSHHMYGVSTKEGAVSDVHYQLGSEAILYLATLAACLVIFPLIWHKGFFAGVQWNGATALRLKRRLLSAAVGCYLLAILSSVMMTGPAHAPIEKLFHAPGAAWLMFGFGITFAPFFEETFFRGFLLPALCTAFDWFAEKAFHQPRRPLAPNDHPEWSRTAMATAALATSIPFALLHAEQTGHAVGPFILLVGISLVLCAVRLITSSLASSVLVHAAYNFLLFSTMLIGTAGFKHLDKM